MIRIAGRSTKPEIVRPESVAEAEVLAFLNRAYPESSLKATPGFYRWRFGEGPHGPSLPHCALATVEGRVVGQMAALRDRIWFHDEWRTCVWMLDFAILPEHRGGSTAARLAKSVMESADLLLIVGTGPKLEKFYTSLGWRRVHVADTMYAMLRPHRLLQLAAAAGDQPSSGGGRSDLLSMAAPFVQAMQKAYGWSVSRGDLEAKTVPDWPADLLELEQSLRPRLGITTDRSAAVLRWKFSNRPFGSHYFVTLRSRKDRQLRACAAVKCMQRGNIRWAEAVDYLADPQDATTFRALMGAVLQEAQRQAADFVRLRCSIQCHLAALTAPFWIRKNRPVIDDLLVYSKDQQVVEELLASPWHLTSIVSDRTDHGADETD